jgi:hypothetical protein
MLVSRGCSAVEQNTRLEMALGSGIAGGMRVVSHHHTMVFFSSRLSVNRNIQDLFTRAHIEIAGRLVREVREADS